MARTDASTKAWINKHPLSQSDLINYGLHLIKMVESNLLQAQTYISTITIEPKAKEDLPF